MIRVAVLVVAAAAAALVLRYQVFPTDEEPRRVDAVVVLAGGDERLPAALELVEAGVAPVLVLDPDQPSWEALCGRNEPYEVVCYRPEPFSTRGEAQGVGRIARERGWESVAVVTSTYHLTRARLLFDRCLEGAVAGVSAGWSGSLLSDAFHTLRDAAGTVYALTVARGC